MMNYQESIKYLNKISTLGSKPGLETITELLKRLGNPHRKLKVVHIAGTNGKGSVIAFLNSILTEAGYRVGCFTSPAVFERREIIRINHDFISETDMAILLTGIKDACDEMVTDGFSQPTVFEVETAMAFLYFWKNGCDICLVECGMGGELDATNVFDRVLCSVITSISVDHISFLGSSAPEIAKRKAGIIKGHCPVVVAKQDEDVIRVISDIAKEKDAGIRIGSDAKVQDSTVSYQSSANHHYTFRMQMIGHCQLINVGVAIEAAEVLEEQGYHVLPVIRKGIENAVWQGRMEVICNNPLIIIDGAHNPGAVYELKKTIDLYFTNKKIVFIMGVLADKDFNKEAAMIADRAEAIYTITPNHERALPAKQLAAVLSQYNRNVQSCDSTGQALKSAMADIRENRADMVLAFGSLSFLSELKCDMKNNI